MLKADTLEYRNEKLKNKVIKYSRNKLHFVAYILRNMNDPVFIRDVLDINFDPMDPMDIKIESYGEKNKGKIIYYCNNIAEKDAGFFANYRWLLDALFFADRFGFSPVVNYGDEFIYAENHKVNNTNNAFEYYFEQPYSISVEEALSSYNVVCYSKKDRELSIGFDTYRATEEYMNKLGTIAKKYIRLNQYVKPFIENGIKQIISDKKTLGIHVRGSDFKIGVKGHPVAVEPNEYFSYINEAIDKYQFEQVFLATDEMATVSLFKKSFGNKLVCFEDVTRTDGNISVAFSKSTRENHHYRLGLEVLRDMHTLAKCSGLIAGMSQVSIVARITKASQNDQYEFLKIIDKDLCQDGIDALTLYEQVTKEEKK